MNSSVIAPELVAGKLAAVDNFQAPLSAEAIAKEPRLVEMAWFIQGYPGGPSRLATNLLAAFPDRFVTRTMLKLGKPRSGTYSPAQCYQAWGDFFKLYKGRWMEDVDKPQPVCEMSFKAFLAHYYDDCLSATVANRDKDFRQAASRFNYDFLCDHCRCEAQSELPEVLRRLCVENDYIVAGRWWCDDLIQVLFAFMDRHAAQVRTRLAETEVVAKVFDELDFAWTDKKFVRITGNSRFGKTESLRTWAEMYPGRVRLVTVPCSDSLADLIQEVAVALGMASFGTSGPTLRRKVEFILQHGRLGIIADESHFLAPMDYNKHTSPKRLNWVRTAVRDRGLPCVLCATPQAYEGQMARFEKTTQYNMDQWLGRECIICRLPEALSKEDLAACLAFHFPALHGAAADLVISAALRSRSYLQALADIKDRALWLARKRNGTGITQADLKAAIVDVTGDAGLSPAPIETLAEAPRRPRKTPAECIEALRPGTRPTISQPGPEPDAEVLRHARRDTFPVSAGEPAVPA